MLRLLKGVPGSEGAAQVLASVPCARSALCANLVQETVNAHQHPAQPVTVVACTSAEGGALMRPAPAGHGRLPERAAAGERLHGLPAAQPAAGLPAGRLPVRPAAGAPCSGLLTLRLLPSWLLSVSALHAEPLWRRPAAPEHAVVVQTAPASPTAALGGPCCPGAAAWSLAADKVPRLHRWTSMSASPPSACCGTRPTCWARAAPLASSPRTRLARPRAPLRRQRPPTSAPSARRPCCASCSGRCRSLHLPACGAGMP